MVKKIITVLVFYLASLPAYAYDGETLASDVANVLAVQEGSTEGVYFIHVFDGMWPVPQRFIVIPQTSHNTKIYTSAYTGSLTLEKIDDPSAVEDMKQDVTEFNDRLSIDIEWQELKKDDLNIFELADDDAVVVYIWNDKFETLLSIIAPTDLFQASLETFLACREKQCTPFHLQNKQSPPKEPTH